MKIALLAAGAAGMYCGSCIRDNTLARAMIRQGADALLIPLYTPLRVDGRDASTGRVFFGGINIYLQQKFSFFRKTPRWVDWMFDSGPAMALAAKMSSATRAEDLGELTVSTLLGGDGPQVKEVDRLCDWLASEVKPDVICLPNAMFVGAARALKRATDAPVVCSLTGEDLFLDGLIEPWRTRAMDILRERARDIDRFIAVSGYYADHMAPYMGVERDLIDVVPIGIDITGYGRTGARPTEPFTIGYLARIAPEKGLSQLADAFIEMRRRPGCGDTRLRVAGWMSPREKGYLEEIRARARAAGAGDALEIVGEVTLAEKRAFLGTISALCVPTEYRDPKGLFALEAMAHGVPVLLPAHGAFPELIEATGGGDLFRAGDAGHLVEKLIELKNFRETADRMALRGQQMVRTRFTDTQMARATMDVFTRVVESRRSEADVKRAGAV